MSVELTINLTWDESFPGWAATATGNRWEELQQGKVEMSDLPDGIRSTINPSVNPMPMLRDLVSAAARHFDVHPAGIGKVSITVDAAELADFGARGRVA